MGTFYLQYEYWIAVFQLVLAMLGMGATLTPKDFQEVVLEPKAVSSGTIIQLVLVPLIALTFIRVFGITGGVAVGVALIAAIPGGTISNIFTHFARGNVALSISITAMTTIACLVTTPIILDLLISAYMPDGFVMPKAQMMREIAVTMLLPLAAGMIYLKLFPGTAETFAKWCVRGSLFGVFLIIAGSTASGRLDLDAFGTDNVLVICLLITVMAGATWMACRFLGLSVGDSAAIKMEVVVRSINLGVMLKASLFPANIDQADPLGDMVLFSLLLYGALQMAIAPILIAWGRRSGAALTRNA